MGISKEKDYLYTNQCINDTIYVLTFNKIL
jgi:hypothetical protein